MAAKTTTRGSKLFILKDPEANKSGRMMMAVRGEGLPRLKAPFEHGCLFIIFTIEFPSSVSAKALKELPALLGPAKSVAKNSEEDDDVEVVELKEVRRRPSSPLLPLLSPPLPSSPLLPLLLMCGPDVRS